MACGQDWTNAVRCSISFCPFVLSLVRLLWRPILKRCSRDEPIDQNGKKLSLTRNASTSWPFHSSQRTNDDWLLSSVCAGRLHETIPWVRLYATQQIILAGFCCIWKSKMTVFRPIVQKYSAFRLFLVR